MSSVYSFDKKKLQWLEEHGYELDDTFEAVFVFHLKQGDANFQTRFTAEELLSKTISELNEMDELLWARARHELAQLRYSSKTLRIRSMGDE